ncbi:coiled-coil domain-containing protein [Legionella sp. D16C41]|uniref:coiled-coil domain-containing protein n=1 Tax=Legionella sp. D16C41 TaxID=3402688 RepID=UPI003AF55815
MPSVIYRKTPFIEEILKIYEEGKGDISGSIISHDLDQVQGWLAYLHLANQRGAIQGLKLPTPGGLSELTLAIAMQNKEDEELKRKCHYYNFVYNTCAQYIADNQKRYFGSANLADISHGKVIAMALLAHLCEQALKCPNEREKYHNRIQSFVKRLLKNPEIQKSHSNDTNYLSCLSALQRIYSEEMEIHKPEPGNRVKEFYTKVSKTLTSLGEMTRRTNNLLFPLLSSQTTVTLSTLLDLAPSKGPITTEEAKLLNDPIIKQVFIDPVFSYEELYQNLYKGLAYKLKPEQNYLLKAIEKNKKNLIELIQLRDRLMVLTEELNKIYKLANQNGVNFFHQFLKLANPYLLEIDRVNKLLHNAIEQFDIDCYQVYTEGKRNGTINTEWQSIFSDKVPLEQAKEQFKVVYQNLNETFTAIPFDFYQAFVSLHDDATAVAKRGQSLFGAQFADLTESTFSKDIDKAQNTELKRQDELLVSRLEAIIVEYVDLLNKAQQAKSSADQNQEELEKVIALLTYRKEVMEQALKAFKQDRQDSQLDDWVLIEIDRGASVICEEDQNGFLQIFKKYLTLGSKSTEEIEKLKQTLKEHKQEIEEANRKIKELEHEKSDLDSKNKKLEEEVARLKEIEIKFQEENAKLQVENKNKDNITRIIRSPIFITRERICSIRFDNFCEFLNKKLTPDLNQGMATVVDNIQTILIEVGKVREAYKSDSKNKDATWFFSHNQNGAKNAEEVIETFKAHLQSEVVKEIQKFIIDVNKVGNVDNSQQVIAQRLEKLSKDLGQIIVKNISSALANERFSSHKQYSFRNYLRHLHAELVKDDRTFASNLLEANPDQIKNLSNNVKNAVAGNFSREDLDDYSRTALMGFNAN